MTVISPKGDQPTFIKICGITTLGDARAAVRAGANALGFVLAPSPRRVAPAKVREIASHVHPAVQRFGIFVDAPLEKVMSVVSTAGLNAVQLQGSESDEFVEELKRAMPSLFVSKVVRARSAKVLQNIDPSPADAVLLDRRDPYDPAARPRTIPLSWMKELPVERLVVAGGLTAANVRKVVEQVRPWGVDVSSGVEAAPGKKDPQKMRSFVRAVRAAEGSSV